MKKLSVKRLWHRWLLSFVSLGVILGLLEYSGLRFGLVKAQQIVNWLITSFYLYPSMLVIKSRAREEGAKAILICSKWLIIVMSLWVTLASIAMVYYFLVGLKLIT